MTRPTPETLAHAARRRPAEGVARPANPTGATTTALTPSAGPVIAPVPVSGAGSLVRSLEALGVEVAFGIPGGAILPAYDPLYDSTVP